MPPEHARRFNSPSSSIKLFGVQIDIKNGAGGGSNIRKSKSLDNLQSSDAGNAAVEPSGYLSDGLIHQSSRSHSRKKGRPWSEEEHRSFLIGLETLGKGDWKGIANKYVPTRNSSQVASHAQKYFIRKSETKKKRRRMSVFDIPLADNANQSSQGGSQAEISQSSSTSRAPFKTAERPPLSPMTRHGSVPDFRSMNYSSLLSNLSRGAAAQTVKPKVAWVPLVTNAKIDGTLGLAHKKATQANKDELGIDISNLEI